MALFCTSFCNSAHRLCDGMPVNHECYVLDPAALRAEQAGGGIDSYGAVKQPRRRHLGVKGDKPLKLHVYSDSGHGWVRVAREELECFGLLGKVSAYSYQRGSWVYLEEDSDAPLLFKALLDDSRPYTLVEHTCSTKESVIRRYARFGRTMGECMPGRLKA